VTPKNERRASDKRFMLTSHDGTVAAGSQELRANVAQNSPPKKQKCIPGDGMVHPAIFRS
jgi:hypothetical protein